MIASDFEGLKEGIVSCIKNNGAGEITGDVLQEQLLNIVNETEAETSDLRILIESMGGGNGDIPIVESEEKLDSLTVPNGSVASVSTATTETKTLSALRVKQSEDVVFKELDRVQTINCNFIEGQTLSEPSSCRFISPSGLGILLSTDKNEVNVRYTVNGIEGEPIFLADFSVAMPSVNIEAVDELDFLVANAEGGVYYVGLESGSLAELEQFFSAVVTTHDADLYIKDDDYAWEKLATKDELSEKQDTLVSGENLKTLNGESLLGSGNIELDLSEYAKQADLETLTTEVIANGKVTAAALTDLNDKIAEIEAGGQSITIDSDFSTTSENPVQNKVVTAGLSEKQDTLVSGTSIKTINGNSLLGSGDLEVVTDISSCATKDEVTAVSNTVTANKTATDASIQSLTETVTSNKTSADAAISDANARIDGVEESVTTITTNYATKAELSESIASLTTEIEASEKVAAASLNELNDKITEIIARLDALSA